MFGRRSPRMPEPDEVLVGRQSPPAVPELHQVSGARIVPPFPEGTATAIFGMGCFWGAERLFWQTPGVFSTAVGYAGGSTPNPTYDEVCSGLTGHTEVVLVVYRPEEVGFGRLLEVFWEGHDPTQGYRQGNDIGTQYRSAIYTTTADQQALAVRSRAAYAEVLGAAGYGNVTTEVAPASPFYYAEGYHQQYLAKNPNGYCGIGGTGVACPTGLVTEP